MTYCSTCGRPFTPRRHYYHQRFDCWRAEQNDQTSSATWRAGYAAGLAAGRGDRRGVGLDHALLLEIVGLVHPDRHPPERFERANRVTARVLALRDAVGVRR